MLFAARSTTGCQSWVASDSRTARSVPSALLGARLNPQIAGSAATAA